MFLELDMSALDNTYRHSIEERIPKSVESLNWLKAEALQETGMAGWFDSPRKSGFDELAKIKAYKDALEIPYNLVVVVGIGGSYAGTKAVIDALNHSFDADLPGLHDRPKICFAGQNLSEQYLVELFDYMNEHEVLLNVISKSGGTLEPSVAFRVLESYIEERYGNEAKQRIVVTTGAKGQLRQHAEKKGYSCFSIPESVGGRYSMLTAVSLLPLALASFDCHALLSGADMFYETIRDQVEHEHPVLSLAAMRHVAWEDEKMIDLFSYSEPKLGALVEWWKQLFGESEGKQGKGLFPAGMLYSTDLHSLGQYVQEGPEILMETFFEVEHSVSTPLRKRIQVTQSTGTSDDPMTALQGKYLNDLDRIAIDASVYAHHRRGHPCVRLKMKELDEFHLGYVVAFFKTVCAVSANLLGVNPFDQPGVEVYKKRMWEMIES